MNFLLIQYPSVPLEFIIDASPRHNLDSLCRYYPRDIIGRRAGTTILCVGWIDLQGAEPADDIIRKHRSLIRDILEHGQTRLWLITIPEQSAPDHPMLSEKIRLFNQYLRSLPHHPRVSLADFDQIIQEYQKKQADRGNMMRSLFQESGKPNSLGQTLLAWNLAQKVAIIPDPR